MRKTHVVHAPAKVNLALAVGDANEDPTDPRHPISSWFVGVTLYDDLELTTLEADYFSRYAIIWAPDALRKTDIDWSITKDLAVRAHLLLEQHVGRKLPVQLKLEKRIPVMAGLGGGSSDAAAMLLGCNALFDLDLDRDELHALAAKLGSDVPYFLNAASSLVEGYGEIMSPAHPPGQLDLVLVFPECVCGTAQVYREFDQMAALRREMNATFERGRDAVRRLARGETPLNAEALFNDLAPAARQVAPELSELLEQASRIAERPAHVTGSGSAFFLICDDPMHAEYLARACVDQLDVPAINVTRHAGNPA